MITSIQVNKDLKQKMDKLKVHPRETYNELIERLVGLTSPNNADKESLVETIEVLSDPETMREIAEAMEEIQKGNFGKSLGQIKKELKVNVWNIFSASSRKIS